MHSVLWSLQQVEIGLQFVTGSMDLSEVYCDDFKVVAMQYLSSLGGFWFDFITSLPWSFNDLYAYQVCTCSVRGEIEIARDCRFERIEISSE